jgi:hypothetical protein
MSTNTILASAPLTTTNYVLKANGTTLGNSLIFDNGTNVGIGTSSPSGALQVSNAGYAIFSNSAHTQTPLSTGLSIGYNRSGANGEVSLVWGAPAAGFNFEIASVTSGTITPRMTITNAGNVGIGTSSPNLTNINRTVLDINGTSTSLLGLSVGGTAKSYLFQNGNDLFINSISGIMAFNVETANYMSFATTNAERMRITSGGQTLIFNTASLYSNVRLSVKQTTGDATAEIWSSWAGDQGTAALFIVKYDNVNTASQVFQRFVIGNGNFTSGQINANGANAAAFGSWSDRRLKENIVELETQLDKILALKPSEFDYKNGSGHQIGFIAQEMQEVYPDVVGEDSEGFLTVTGWSKTEARLVKAIQEQNALITSLQEQINNIVATK